MRLVDVVIAFPFLVLVIAILAVVGPGVKGIYIAVLAVAWAMYARLTRAEMLVLREQQFMLAGEALGFSRRRIIFRHAIPNLLRPNLVFSMADFVLNILLVASLSFLGLGVRPPTPEWGAMVAEGQNFLLNAWWITTLPGHRHRRRRDRPQPGRRRSRGPLWASGSGSPSIPAEAGSERRAHMKVFISVDMEGATAMTDPEDVLPQGSDYQRGRVFMTGDANAAVLGAFDAGATEVVVNDSHWIMRNLLIEQIDPRARVIKGFHKPMCMMQGVDESVDAAVFVGYHSCAGTEQGVLAHTLLGKEVQNMLINGEPTGETRLNALLCGHFGVPVAFVAGDDTVCREAKNVLGDDLPTFAVKDGIDMFTANCLHPEVSQKGIREGVAAALRRPGESRRSTRWRCRSRSASSSTRRRSRRHASTSRRSASRPVHDRVHDGRHAEGDEDDLRRAPARAPGRAEGDLQLSAPKGASSASLRDRDDRTRSWPCGTS